MSNYGTLIFPYFSFVTIMFSLSRVAIPKDGAAFQDINPKVCD